MDAYPVYVYPLNICKAQMVSTSTRPIDYRNIDIYTIFSMKSVCCNKC